MIMLVPAQYAQMATIAEEESSPDLVLQVITVKTHQQLFRFQILQTFYATLTTGVLKGLTFLETLCLVESDSLVLIKEERQSKTVLNANLAIYVEQASSLAQSENTVQMVMW